MKHNLVELIQDWEKENDTGRNEGSTGVENLCKLARTLGYKDSQYFGQFKDGCYGDLINFLEDNPGCIEAIKEWIGENGCDEWKEGLESEVSEKTCEECGEPCKHFMVDGQHEVYGCPDCDS
jgi:hypothetical protein